MALKGTEYEGLQPLVEKAVLKYCSGRDSIMNCAYKCIVKKYEKRKMADKLSSYLDSSKASKLASKLDDILYQFEKEHKKEKRKNGDENSSSTAKRAKFQEEVKENGNGVAPPEDKKPPEPTVVDGPAAPTPQAAVLTAEQIREMMENTKKMIVERKMAMQQSLPGSPALAPAGAMGFPLMQRPPRPLGGQQTPLYQNFNPRRPANANFRLDAVANVNSLPRGPIAISQPPPGILAGLRLPPPPAVVAPTVLDGDADTGLRLGDLHAEIKNKMGALGIAVSAFSGAGPAGKIPPLMPPTEGGKRSMFDITAVPRQPTAPQPGKLRLDDKGRMVDAEGNVILMVGPQPELKANLRAVKKKEAESGTQSVVKGEAPSPVPSGSDLDQPEFFDPRVNMKSQLRTGRRMKFNEPGKFVKIGTQLRMKAQLQKVQNEINALAKKTGISAVTKLALATSSIQKADKLAGLEDVPDIEWWDVIVLKGQSYGETEEEIKANVNETRITHLIEHPTRVTDPGKADEDIALPIFLTKKEQKKRRRQNRRETWKEKQEKIRLGLEPAAEPKMTISNLMRVLGTDAVQDPTKVEAHVREQMAKRQKKHQEENAARKLTKEQRREKKIKKLKEDVTRGVRVTVYRVRSLIDQSKKFKVEMNCKQLLMTGAIVLHKETNVIVVEGGPKQQKTFKRLMLQRIRWHEERVVKKDDADEKPARKRRDDDDEDADGQGLSEAERNKCVLVWEGIVKERAFGEVAFKICPTEGYARDFFKKRGVEHYWDLAYSGTILEAAEEDY